MPRDVDDVAEALGRQHPDLGALVLEDDVRRDGRAVQEVVDVGEGDPGLLAELPDALDDCPRGVVGGGGDLVHRGATAFLVDEDQVGEGSADVDSDALHARPPWLSDASARPGSAGMISRPTRSIWVTWPFR